MISGKARRTAGLFQCSERGRAATKYKYWLTEDGLLRLEAWARDGLTDDQLAAEIKISRSTLSEWKKQHEKIAEALAHGREVADIKVENELYRNATGYEYTEEVAFKLRRVEYGPDGKKTAEYEEIDKTEVQRWHPGETGAQFIWLKNRRPDTWRDHPVGEANDGVINLVHSTERPQYGEDDSA